MKYMGNVLLEYVNSLAQNLQKVRKVGLLVPEYFLLKVRRQNCYSINKLLTAGLSSAVLAREVKGFIWCIRMFQEYKNSAGLYYNVTCKYASNL